MKIIEIMPVFKLAGAEIMCENLVYELIKQGHQVTVISMFTHHSSITKRLEEHGVDIKYLDKKDGLDLSMFFKILKIFMAEKPDVLHTHLYTLKYAIPGAVLAGVKKRVHTVHNMAQKEVGNSERKLQSIFFRFFKVVPVALSKLIQDTIIDEYHLDKDSVPVVYNGIDLSACKDKVDYEINETFKILHIGRFAEQKNHLGLLEAFKLFHEKYSQSELWLIGEGPKKEEAENYVVACDLLNNVHFLGSKDNVHEYLYKADIFTLPSLYEGVPITLIEAMGTGLPIVATAVGGVPDMLNSESSILTDVDTTEICNAFEKYYLDKVLRSTHGRKVKFDAEMFSSEKMAENYIGIFSKL